MRCSRYGNMGRMYVILTGELLEKENCFVPGAASGS